MKVKVALAVIVALILLSPSVQAAVVTVDVTIKVVNPQARGITVVYKTELGEKTIELDVTRRAEITVNGKDGTLDSLGPGLKATVSYDKDLGVVTKIEAKGKPVVATKPELLEVSELNDESMNSVSCLSEDGLTIYWTRNTGGMNRTLWTAHRDNPQLLFTNKKQLFKGASLTVSSDGLEMILYTDRSDGQPDFSLYVTTREALDKPWQRPREIPELAKFFSSGPCLSPDGLTLYFSVRPAPKKWGDVSLVHSTRKDKSSPWSRPKPVFNVSVDEGALRFPSMTADGLNLLCGIGRPNETGEKGSIMIWSRSAIGTPFSKGKYIEPDSLPPLVCSLGCKYVAATNELFFTRGFYQDKKPVPKKIGIWVVKNLTLPH